MAKAKTQTEVDSANKPGNQVAEVQSGTLATSADMSEMYAADKGMGSEEATADAYAIPFLSILQKGSPQVDETMGEPLPGAKAGMFFNNVTNELLDGKEGILIMPCYFRRDFIRWGPREGGGGGFKGLLSPEEVAGLRQAGKIKDFDGGLYFPEPDGSVNPKRSHRVGDHRNHYVMYKSKDGHLRGAVLSLTSTQLRKSKQLMSLLADVRMEDSKTKQKFSPAAFANWVKASTIGESNDKGSWFGIKFELNGFTDPETYQIGRKFYTEVRSNNVTVKYEDVDSAGGAPQQRSSRDDPDGAF